MSLFILYSICATYLTLSKRLQFGKEEQQNERILTFIKNRSKRYVACSDVKNHNTIDAKHNSYLADGAYRI